MAEAEGRAGPAGEQPRRSTWARWRSSGWILLVLDLACLLVGQVLANGARYDHSDDRMDLLWPALAAVVSIMIFPAVAAVLRLHQGRYELASADEFRSLAAAMAMTTGTVLVLDLAAGSQRAMPLSVPVVAGLAAFVLAIGYRVVLSSRRASAAPPHGGRRTLVFGAGAAAQPLVRSMLWDRESPYLPVGLLDDDPAKRHLRIRGVHMVGGREDILEAVAATRAEVLVIAVPSAPAALVRDVSQRAVAAGLSVKVLPKLSDLLDRQGVGIRDVRDINIADLLGRRQIETDLAEIAGYLRGRRVLVTGAGGSIGAELSRQIARYAPAELMMLDRDESALHGLQLTMYGEARLDLPQAVLADIRDGEALLSLFAERRPEVVFHAAALKHVNMLEQYPSEGWKTNVLGTLNVLAASTAVGVSTFVNISTDKAADPANVLGRTKRLAERLTATYAERDHRRFLSVRFGNVLGSRGSVLETFAAQIARGGPVTVTDPAVTRFFMTIPEAVQLVIQAGAIGSAGEALVLDMGEPVRISDVAHQLIALAGRTIDVRYTGLRPGEKLHEELFGSGEQGNRPAHPLISHVLVPPLEPEALERIRTGHGAAEADDPGQHAAGVGTGDGMVAR